MTRQSSDLKARRLTALTILLGIGIFVVHGLINGSFTIQLWIQSTFVALFLIIVVGIVTWIIELIRDITDRLP